MGSFYSPHPSDWLQSLLEQVSRKRGLLIGAILVVALISFEMFNYSTTLFALNDLLGELRFAGVRWAVILAFAFCGIDFAGIARIFIPEEQASSTQELWFLFGAWFLAALMNAMLTWWGVSMALVNHTLASTAVVSPQLLQTAVPVGIAIIVWVTRFLLISTFSLAGPRLFSIYARQVAPRRTARSAPPSYTEPYRPMPAPAPMQARPAAPRPASPRPQVKRPEPEYVPDASFEPAESLPENVSPSGAPESTSAGYRFSHRL
jgi:hypothetical protein